MSPNVSRTSWPKPPGLSCKEDRQDWKELWAGGKGPDTWRETSLSANNWDPETFWAQTVTGLVAEPLSSVLSLGWGTLVLAPAHLGPETTIRDIPLHIHRDPLYLKAVTGWWEEEDHLQLCINMLCSDTWKSMPECPNQCWVRVWRMSDQAVVSPWV